MIFPMQTLFSALAVANIHGGTALDNVATVEGTEVSGVAGRLLAGKDLRPQFRKGGAEVHWSKARGKSQVANKPKADGVVEMVDDGIPPHRGRSSNASLKGGADPRSSPHDGTGTDEDVVDGVGRVLIEASPVSVAACGADYVECDDGYAVIGGVKNTSLTCAGACGGRCCSGKLACDGFTGNVCKDGASCGGFTACQYANISRVVNSCIGTRACLSTARSNGAAGDFGNSCVGMEACQYMADHGAAGDFANSCVGRSACNRGAHRGSIRGMSESCNGLNACGYVASTTGSSIGTMEGSCQGDQACVNAFRRPGGIGPDLVLGDAVNCCSAAAPCTNAISLPAGSCGFMEASLFYPWTIDFVDLDVNFTVSSDNELSLNYVIGKGREYEALLKQKDCESNITDINITHTDPPARIDKNSTLDSLILAYDIPKDDIASSIIWNNETNKIELCQILNLIIPATGNTNKMVITQDKREIDVNFDLSVGFNITNDLAAGTTETANSTTEVSGYVSACKCNATSYGCNADALEPNSELFVCVTSIDSDVEVDELVRMIITQGDNRKLNVIVNGTVQVSSITSLDYDRSENGVRVSTRVPSNIFTFAANENITIIGDVDMKLVGTSRKLRALVGDADDTTDGREQAPYELEINLEEDLEFAAKDQDPMGSSGHVMGKGSAILGMISPLAFYFMG